jgi:hypothetical protein
MLGFLVWYFYLFIYLFTYLLTYLPAGDEPRHLQSPGFVSIGELSGAKV